MTPKNLGRFEVVGELGRGAMGVVYKGTDPKIGRMVALKTIQFSLTNGDADGMQMRERFLVEARATGQLQHPNILTIYDVGEEGDLTYIAMEFIEGGDLEEMVRGNKFRDYDHIIDIVRQVADGLDHAHSKGIVHRDIKPANIMMAGGKIPKIADFGLARLSNSTLTATGTVLGTPSYMAPEQIRGRKIDGRADLFALGVILYEMLTGEKPYGGDSITSVIYRVVNEEPIPPKKLNMDLPEAIDQFMQKALAKEPAQRFQTGAEFAEGLRLLQKGLYTAEIPKAAPSAMATQKMPAFEETQKVTPKKNNTLIIGGVAAGLVALIGVAALLMSGGKKEEKTAEVILPVETAAPVQATTPPAPPAKTAKQPKQSEKPATAVKQDLKAAPAKPAEKTPPPSKSEPAKASGESAPKVEGKKAGKGTPLAVSMLNIISNPSEADVHLNGKSYGTTPFKKDMEDGDYELKLEKKGFAPYMEKITLKGAFTIKAELKPEKADTPQKKEKGGLEGMLASGSANLIVEATPGDKMTVDGKSYTEFPVELKDVNIGKHNIFIVRKGKKPFLKTVDLKPGETLTVTPAFE